MEQQKLSKEEIKAVDINNVNNLSCSNILYEELNLRNLMKRECYLLG
jgi:hypothetical protein